MLGIEPKDFDIATDARPEQVKPLFRRAYVIGRRFRLVHVHVGAEVVEVSTFRAANAGGDATDEHGRLLSDNVYGTQAEDAARRDFTVNALYFDPSTEEVWDFVGGVTDVRARRMKLIGPPVTRYREDPVRMLRAVRLAAKLGCTIEKRTAEPIPRLADLIRNVPPRGCSTRCRSSCSPGTPPRRSRSLRAHGLHHGLLPLLDVILEQPRGHALHRGRAREHRRPRARRQATCRPHSCSRPSSGTRCSRQWNAAKARGERPLPALFEAMDRVLGAAGGAASPIPRRFEATIKEIWSLQPRFEQRAGSRPLPPARAPAIPRRVRLPAAACRRRAKRRRRWSTGGRASRKRSRRARGDAAARRGAEEVAPLARPRAQARRRAAPRRAAEAAARRPSADSTPSSAMPSPASGSAATSSHPRRQLARAVAALGRLPRTRLVALSPNYVTAPVGVSDAQPDYVNAVRAPSTPHSRRARCSTRLPAIERRHAPRRAARATPRGRSTSICYYSAAVASRSRDSRCRTRACTSARSCCVRWPTSRRRHDPRPWARASAAARRRGPAHRAHAHPRLTPRCHRA